MTVKTTGAEFKKFWNDKSWWVDDAYVEDEIVLVDGKQLPEYSDYLSGMTNESLVSISGGYIMDHPDYPDASLEGFFRKWRKAQTTTRIIVECDNDKMEYIKQAIKSAGGKIL